MGKTKQLIKKENLEIDGYFRKAVCSVEIYEIENGKKEIILCPPEGIEGYCGGSTTNFYEYFATVVKKIYLAETINRNITWIDRQIYSYSDFCPTRELSVSMDFDGAKYSNPIWGGRSHGKFSRLF
jgi:hypothetical protein